MKKLNKKEMEIVINKIAELNMEFYNNCTSSEEDIYYQIGKHCSKINYLTSLIENGYDSAFDFETVMKILN